MVMGSSSLGDLARLRPGVRRRRVSSYDPKGGNADWWEVATDETRAIMDVTGPGCIKHIWMTMWCHDEFQFRKVVLRMYWDGEENPSVEVPIGDFFGWGTT